MVQHEAQHLPAVLSHLMLALRDALGVPSTRVHVDMTTFVSYVLPPMACGHAVAALAMAPKTRAARVALLPIIALLALRAVLSVDVSFGEPGLKILNGYFVCAMFNVVGRAIDFTLANEPLVRQLRPANSAPSTIMDVIDLAANCRGIGWNWSHGLHVPHDKRPSNRVAFTLCALFSATRHALLSGALLRALLSFPGLNPTTNLKQPTIFDTSLSLVPRYFRAGVFSFLSALLGYASMQVLYDFFTVPAVLVLRQDPAQWPPAFDAPWRATSLTDFWGWRWHQWCRRTFLCVGGRPLSLLLGRRAGAVLGAFAVSALMHDVFLRAWDANTGAAESWRMYVGFGGMAPAVLAEYGFYRATGRKLGGVLGWVWTMAWMVSLGSVMIEGVVRTAAAAAATVGGGGFEGPATLVDGLPSLPVLASVGAWIERLVLGFDGWLRGV